MIYKFVCGWVRKIRHHFVSLVGFSMSTMQSYPACFFSPRMLQLLIGQGHGGEDFISTSVCREVRKTALKVFEYRRRRRDNAHHLVIPAYNSVERRGETCSLFTSGVSCQYKYRVTNTLSLLLILFQRPPSGRLAKQPADNLRTTNPEPSRWFTSTTSVSTVLSAIMGQRGQSERGLKSFPR